MKSRMIVSFMVIALAAALIGGATMAWFTDRENAMEQTFTAGILDISTSNNLLGLELPTIVHMNPGDTFGPFEIEIVNVGNKRLFWVGDWRFETLDELDDRLLDALYIKTMKMEFLDSNGNDWTEDPWYSGYEFIKDGKANKVVFPDGSYNVGEYETYRALQGTTLIDNNKVDVISLRNFLDNNAMLPGPYEHMGALKPGYKYKLTVEFGFLKEAGNHYQGIESEVSPVTISFVVNAMQVNEEAMNDFGESFNYALGTNQINWANNQLALQQVKE